MLTEFDLASGFTEDLGHSLTSDSIVDIEKVVDGLMHLISNISVAEFCLAASPRQIFETSSPKLLTRPLLNLGLRIGYCISEFPYMTDI